MQLVHDVFIKRSVPQIRDWIEFFTEPGLDKTNAEKSTRKSLKKTGILLPISIAISDESAIKDIYMKSYICSRSNVFKLSLFQYLFLLKRTSVCI